MLFGLFRLLLLLFYKACCVYETQKSLIKFHIFDFTIYFMYNSRFPIFCNRSQKAVAAQLLLCEHVLDRPDIALDSEQLKRERNKAYSKVSILLNRKSMV